MANLILNTEVDNFLQSNSKASMRTALNLKSAALEEASTFATKVENDLKIGRTQIDSTNFQYASNELQLIDGSIDSTKIGEGSITKDRIEDLSSMTLLGNTTLVSNAPAEVGIITETAGIATNDNDTSIPTSAAVKDYVDAEIATSVVTSYKSSFVSLPANGSNAVFPHSLGDIPDIVNVQLKCISASNGFAVGEIIALSNSYAYGSYGNGVEIDATNITFHSAPNGLIFIAPDGTYKYSLTIANFEIRVIAIKL